MRNPWPLSTLCLVSSLSAQTYVNPFQGSKNTFNQQDIIVLYSQPNANAVVQRTYGFDWIAAAGGQSTDVITPMTPAVPVNGATLADNRYMSAKTGRFNNDRKDDIFLAMRTADGWQCALNTLNADFDPTDSSSTYDLPSPSAYVTIPATGSGFPKVAVGDLDGDGTDEAAVAWWEPLNDLVHVQVLDSDSSLELQLRASISDRASLRVQGRSAYDLGVGDLNGDGKAELLLIGLEESASGNAELQVFVQVYEVMGEGSATLEPRGSMVLNDADLHAGGTGLLLYAQTAITGVLARPDTLPDTSRDLFASFAFSRGSTQNSYMNFFQYLLRASADLNTVTLLDQHSSVDGSAANPSGNFPLEIGIGDINGDWIEDVALLARSGVHLFQVMGDSIQPRGSFGSGMDLEGGSYGMNEAVDHMELGDVDMDERDEVVLFIHYQDMEPPDEHTFAISVIGRDADFGPDGGHNLSIIDQANGSARSHAIALGDLDGRNLRLGTPVVRDCEFVQPVFTIDAIPSHFDVVNGVQYDVNNCYPEQDCDLSVQVTQTGSTTAQTTASFTADWAVSSSYDAGVGVEGFSMGTNLSMKYGNKFEEVNTTANTQTLSIAINATADDIVQYIKFPITTYLYPVLDVTNDTTTWILAAFPANDLSPQTVVANGKSVFNYTPDHEVGNLLSYPPLNNSYNANLNYPTAAGNWTILPPGNLPDYTMSPSGGVVYTLTNGQELSWTDAHTSYAAVNTGISPYGFGIGLPTPEDAGFTYDNLAPGWEPNDVEASLLTLFTNEASEETEYVITTANIIGSPNEFNYVVRPKVFWNSDGAASVAFELDMNAAPGSGSFWSQAYTTAPDPALNLPYRNDSIINPDLTNTTNLRRTKSMRFSTLLPQVGDTFSIFLRVFNYSFVTTPGPVPFKLYLGDPAQGGSPIADVTGSTLFHTNAALGARGREEVDVRVVATPEMTVGGFVRIFAELDPVDDIDEIHEGNNMGWAQFGYACNQPGLLVSVPELAHSIAAERLHIWPVPAHDQLIIAHDLRGAGTSSGLVRITDVLGKEVARFQVPAQYQGRIHWNTRSVAPGFYFVGLYDAHGLRGSAKAVVE